MTKKHYRISKKQGFWPNARSHYRIYWDADVRMQKWGFRTTKSNKTKIRFWVYTPWIAICAELGAGEH